MPKLDILISKYVSLTKLKLWFARLLYKIVRPFTGKDILICERNGINYELDLSEGIDLSIYLFGSFQKHVTKAMTVTSNSPIILDIGGNIGYITLELAKKYPKATLHVFEPTNYAFQKLTKNISLNPQLAQHIVLNKAIVSNELTGPKDVKLFSSWKLNSINNDNHKVHGGIAQTTSKTEVLTIDSYIDSKKIQNLDLIKIDTDGSELDILRGAKNSISLFKPLIIFEVGLYLLEERKLKFQDYRYFFETMNYEIKLANSDKIVTDDNYETYIPRLGTTDLIASFKRM